MTDRQLGHMDRRRFIRLVGIGTAAGLARPLLDAGIAGAATGAPSAGVPLKVGVVVPTGASYGPMGASLLAGLQRGFASGSGVAATLVTEPVEQGHSGARTAVTRLLGADVDVVVAGITSPVALGVRQLFEDAGVPLVVANVGGHVVRPSQRSPFVLHTSLLLWQAAYAAGRWAGGQRSTALITATHADSGYDAIYAFRRGFESAGGTIVGTHLTHMSPADDGVGALLREVDEVRSGIVFSLHSGAGARDLLAAWSGPGRAARPPLLGGPFLTEEFFLGTVGASADGVRTVASWSARSATQENAGFYEGYQRDTGVGPDPFAVLGYDTARVVAAGVGAAVASGRGIRRFIDDVPFVSGARGGLLVDRAVNVVTTPLLLRRADGGAGVNHVEVQLGHAAAFPAPMADLGASSGYVNEYLCAGVTAAVVTHAPAKGIPPTPVASGGGGGGGGGGGSPSGTRTPVELSSVVDAARAGGRRRPRRWRPLTARFRRLTRR